MFAALLAVAQEAAAETEESLQVLPDADELLWGAIFFAILATVLIKLVGPKMRKAATDRTARIQGQVQDAERTKLEADQVLDRYKAQLADARGEVQRIIDEGKRTAEALRADIVAKAETEAREIVARAQSDVAGERDRAVAQLRDTLAELSIQLAGRVIERELTSSDAHRQLVDQAIAGLAAGGNGRN